MPSVSCGCEIPDCKAAPHEERPRCSASCDAPTWSEAGWSEGDTTWDGALDWNIHKVGNKVVPVCRECNHMMAMVDDKSGSFNDVGRFGQPGTKLAE